VSHLRASLWFLLFSLLICSVLYPLVLLVIGHTVFSEQADGSLIVDGGGKPVGSQLIAQPFTKDYYFQPRPSAVSYNAAASGASNWGASNYRLRDRVARQLGPIARYGKGAEDYGKMPGQLVGKDVEQWFQQDRYRNMAGIVAQWAQLHPGLAESWIKSADDALKPQWKQGDKEPEPGASFAAQWREDYGDLFAGWREQNPDWAGAPADLARSFFESFSSAHPGSWPILEDYETPANQKRKRLRRVSRASESQSEIQSVFFDMWRQEHNNLPLELVPADMLMASGSGLDPHITLKNALYQLETRVAAAQARKILAAQVDKMIKAAGEAPANDEAQRRRLEKQARQTLEAKAGKRLETYVQEAIAKLVSDHACAPLGGLVGVPLINVLEINLALDKLVE
jgi:K+-transporting ATPase ATPase C chain